MRRLSAALRGQCPIGEDRDVNAAPEAAKVPKHRQGGSRGFAQPL